MAGCRAFIVSAMWSGGVDVEAAGDAVALEAATTKQVHERYLDLTRVERDFRTLKMGLLEIVRCLRAKLSARDGTLS